LSHITADSSRLRAGLGWQPTVDFAEGMAELAHLAEEGTGASPPRAAAATR
jgi:dTDP-L-rhamnose 4-epimerase